MSNYSNNRARLEQEFPTLYPQLYRIIRVRVPTGEDAEDVVSQTFETLLKKAGDFQADQGSLAAWAVGIAKNHILHYWRAHRECVDLERLEYLAAAYDEQLETRLDCQAALEFLSPAERSLLILRYVDGYSAAEIAATSGLTAAALRQQLHRLKKYCRTIINPEKI